MHVFVFVCGCRDWHLEGNKWGYKCRGEKVTLKSNTKCSEKVYHLLIADLLSPVAATQWSSSLWLQVKCEQYWPQQEASSITFGRYTITSIKVTERACFTHHVLDISKSTGQVIWCMQCAGFTTRVKSHLTFCYSTHETVLSGKWCLE